MDQQESLKKYIELKKEYARVQKNQNSLKKEIKDIEVQVMEALIQRQVDSILIDDCQISIYEKKINQTFKKETIEELLTKKLNNNEQAIDLTDSILNNKKSISVDKIKIKLPQN
jgi:hypothetical protein